MEQRKDIPAFPSAKITILAEEGQGPECSSLEWPGISIRDYFAAKAMQGLLSDSEMRQPWGAFAKDAYAMADAMLTAREK